MIRIVNGNIFHSGASALVNPVNCVGVMGRGLALEFKKRYPSNFYAYAEACKRGRLSPGKLFVMRESGGQQPVSIVNFPTKLHWKNPSNLSWISSGLDELREWILANKPASIAIPALGCGLGDLDWPDVSSLIGEKLARLDTEIIVYPPH